MTIMPSRPMFTMPERSAKRPPRPASRIGEARPTAVMKVAPAVSLGWSVTTRTKEKSARRMQPMVTGRSHGRDVNMVANGPVGSGAGGFGDEAREVGAHDVAPIGTGPTRSAAVLSAASFTISRWR